MSEREHSPMHCLQCGHEWGWFVHRIPHQCPRCRSTLWKVRPNMKFKEPTHMMPDLPDYFFDDECESEEVVDEGRSPYYEVRLNRDGQDFSRQGTWSRCVREMSGCSSGRAPVASGSFIGRYMEIGDTISGEYEENHEAWSIKRVR